MAIVLPPSSHSFCTNMGGDVAEVTATSAMRAAETLLRLLPLVLCLVALVLMLKDSQTTDVYGSLSYSNIGAFRYLVHACGVCAGYSLISAVAVAVVLPRPYTMYAAWLLFLLDQLVTYIVLAAGATSMEVAYLAYKGDTDAAWSQACTALGGFCTKAVAAIAITFVTTLCYAALSLISSYRLFTRFDAPLAKDIHTASIQLS